MTDSGTGQVTLAVILILCHTCSGLEVTAPPTQVTLLHSTTVLPCSFRTGTPSINPQFLAIIWSFGDKQVLRFDNKEKEAAKGFSLDENEALKGSASLTIHNVTISDQGIYRCLIIYSPNQEKKEIKLNVHAKPEVKIQEKALSKDNTNKVYCSISGFYPEDVKVTWLRNNIELPVRSEMGTFQMDADMTYRVNNSIVLTPTQIQDNPSIGCQVEHVSLQMPIQDAFTVKYGVVPKVRLTSSRTRDHNELLYVCQAGGFSPEPLSINWLVDGKMADLSKKSAEGLFNREIYYQVNLKEGNIPKEISCRVQHETLVGPVIDTVQVDSYNECTRNCHSGLTAVMIVLLIAGLVCFAIASYLIIKKKYLRRFQVSHIHRQQTFAEEEKVTLYCMALKCPKEVKATWTVVIEGRASITVSDCKTYKDEESGPLLHADYSVKTEQTERKGLKNFTTMLSFNPEASQYKKTEVICKFTCDGKSKERSLTCTYEQKMPEMKDSIKVFFDDSKNIVCAATLENFYPRNIHIQWSYGTDQYRNVGTTKEEINCNTKNRTYNVISECTIPSKSLDKSSDLYNVRVTWKHSSMDHPDNRETTLKEISSRPVMEDLIIPPLLHGMEAKLQCTIRGFFPDKLQVTWLRKDGGDEQLYVLSSSDKYKIPMIESTEQPDNTFTCTASISVTVSALTDNGSEFICRVTHPSLETYLEKSGKLTVKGIPEIEIKYLETTKTLRAIISNFRPNKIKVTWRRILGNKIENYKDDEIKVVDEHENNDGTFTLAREVAVTEKKEYKEYYVIVEHECLKSPIKRKIIRKDGKFSIMEKEQNLECEDTSGDKDIPEIKIQYLGKTLRATVSNFRLDDNNKVTWRCTKENKTENCRANEIKALAEHKNDDGTFTSVTEVSVNTTLAKQRHLYREYEVIVEREHPKSPTTKKIIHENGKFYVMENGQRVFLPKCEDNISRKGHKSNVQ